MQGLADSLVSLQEFGIAIVLFQVIERHYRVRAGNETAQPEVTMLVGVCVLVEITPLAICVRDRDNVSIGYRLVFVVNDHAIHSGAI